METRVSREDWLLLFLSPSALGLEDAPITLDPIRIQKGLFLLSMRGPERGLYSFQPYNWGPFSAQVYGDLDALRLMRLVAAEEVPGRSWRRYRTTEEGDTQARRVAETIGLAATQWLAQTRQFVTSRPFVRLLEDIYAMYPNYASKSMLTNY